MKTLLLAAVLVILLSVGGALAAEKSPQIFSKGFSTIMEPADLWAIANLKHKQLPPIEFDHPTKRRTHIIEIDNEAELRKRCGWPAAPYGGIMVGCTKVYNLEPYADGGCEIFVGPPKTARTGVTRNLIVRHEMGHCNGWASDHAGAR